MIGVVTWVFSVGVFLMVTDNFDTNLFLMLVFIGLLVSAETNKPTETSSKWVVWIRWITRLLAVGFVILVLLSNIGN